MKKFLPILLVILLIHHSQAETCPKQCQCSRLKWTCGAQNINDTVLLEIARSGDPLSANELLLKGNLITHFPAQAFVNFTNLVKVELGKNFLTKPPSNVSLYIPSLTKLSIDQNKISKISKENFIGNQNIKELDIFSNTITEIEPKIFMNMPNLQKAFMENNQIKFLKNGILDGAKNLLWISFDSNGVERIERDAFKDATKLERLWLNRNELSSLPEGVFRNQRLMVLEMKNNQFTDFPAQTINSVSLDLQSNNFTTVREDWFASKPVALYLEENPLHCDCAIYKTFKTLATGNPGFELYGNCQTPENLKGADVYEEILTKNKLNCTACSWNECQNNATCEVVDDLNYACLCSEKNHGKFCQFENMCLDGPCLNNATCLTVENSFKCNCTEGFIGEKCEMEKPCHFKNPCQNNGTCQSIDETSAQYQCLCTDGYSGQNCEIYGEEKTKIKIGYIILIILVVLALIAILVVYLSVKRRRTEKAPITEDTPLNTTEKA